MICGLSGGVDSAVAAALVHKAIGDQLTCVFVDHGLLRKGEAEQVKHDFVEATGIKLIAVDASEDFLTALKGVSEPEKKRKIIGEKFIRTFEKLSARSSKRRVLPARKSSSLFRAPSTRMLWNPAVATAQPTSSRTTMWVACRTTSSSSSSSHCVPCSRMRFVPSVPSLDCRTKSSGVSRSLARARHPHHRRDHQGASGSASRGRRHRSRGAFQGRS